MTTGMMFLFCILMRCIRNVFTLSAVFCDAFQTGDTETIPTFARFLSVPTKVCLSGRLEELSFPCQPARKNAEIVLNECSCVLLHLELWIDFNYILSLRVISSVENMHHDNETKCTWN